MLDSGVCQVCSVRVDSYDPFNGAPLGYKADDRLPRVAQAPVERVVNLGESAQVVLVGERAGDLVGKWEPGFGG